MTTLSSILFWLGIVLMVDGSLGLIFEEKWKKLAVGWNIRRLATVEIGVGSVLVVICFVLSGGL